MPPDPRRTFLFLSQLQISSAEKNTLEKQYRHNNSSVLNFLASPLVSGRGQSRREKFLVPEQKFCLGPLVSGAPKSSDEQKKVIASADVLRISVRNHKNILASAGRSLRR